MRRFICCSKGAGISEQDHPARDDGNIVARYHLEAHSGKVIALAERLAECGHVDNASEFLASLP
jgi:cytochrome c